MSAVSSKCRTTLLQLSAVFGNLTILDLTKKPAMYSNSLSIRQYCIEPAAHRHEFHQLVFPLHGTLSIYMDSFSGTIGAGECLVIQRGVIHRFSANENARFIVADLDVLPDFMTFAIHPILFLPKSFSAFLLFVEIQLQEASFVSLEAKILSLFCALLDGLCKQPILDKRLQPVVATLHRDPQLNHDIASMAKHACLSQTQFKALFKQQLGKSPKSYLTALRMNKAKVLLMNTDMPINLVAERVGYSDHSAFSRRFTGTFGYAPSALR